jgi:cytochrome c-type biogenesis protein CcmH/NrfG
MNAPDLPAIPAARAISGTVFLGVLAALLTIAGASLFLPTTVVEGMPDDPSARGARDLLLGRVMPACGGLRFGSAFLGELERPAPGRPPDAALLERAEMLLRRAVRSHPFEPRSLAALGHLELARRRFEGAARLYRQAVDLRSHCSEARLGLGMALALEADLTADVLERRALELASLAQFSAIDSRSERWLDAAFNRAKLLDRVGRRAQARAAARLYLARDDSSEWAAQLREMAGVFTGGSGRSSSNTP